MNRLMAIGDIHGEYFKLKNLIKKLKPRKKDGCNSRLFVCRQCKTYLSY